LPEAFADFKAALERPRTVDALRLSTLQAYLWGAAVILRGPVDAGDYKRVNFPLVF
jgi:type I restriction enzyme M protein